MPIDIIFPLYRRHHFPPSCSPLTPDSLPHLSTNTGGCTSPQWCCNIKLPFVTTKSWVWSMSTKEWFLIPQSWFQITDTVVKNDWETVAVEHGAAVNLIFSRLSRPALPGRPSNNLGQPMYSMLWLPIEVINIFSATILSCKKNWSTVALIDLVGSAAIVKHTFQCTPAYIVI